MQWLQEMVVREGDDYTEKENAIKASITAAIMEEVDGKIVYGEVRDGDSDLLVAETKVTYIGMAEADGQLVLPHFSVRVFTYDEKAHSYASSETVPGLGAFIVANIEYDSELKPVCEVVLRVIHFEGS